MLIASWLDLCTARLPSHGVAWQQQLMTQKYKKCSKTHPLSVKPRPKWSAAHLFYTSRRIHFTSGRAWFCDNLFCKFSGGPHVVAATWPCTILPIICLTAAYIMLLRKYSWSCGRLLVWFGGFSCKRTHPAARRLICGRDAKASSASGSC